MENIVMRTKRSMRTNTIVTECIIAMNISMSTDVAVSMSTGARGFRREKFLHIL